MNFLNNAACRRFMLEYAKQNRPFHEFRRVSKKTLLRLSEQARVWMVDHVNRFPSKGTTL